MALFTSFPKRFCNCFSFTFVKQFADIRSSCFQLLNRAEKNVGNMFWEIVFHTDVDAFIN